jgi:uncharacterized membrane protein (UPF0127 family)
MATGVRRNLCHDPWLCTGRVGVYPSTTGPERRVVAQDPWLCTLPFWRVIGLIILSILLVPGCDEKTAAGVESVKLGDRWFHLDVVDTDAKRIQGLSGRTEIAPDGGMLFVFPRARPLTFVMRDCLVPIDIIFVDASARIVAMHHMPVEEARRPDEPKAEVPAQDKYEQRLVRYPSRFAAQFVIELKGGTLPALGLKEGDKLPLDTERLKAAAK